MDPRIPDEHEAFEFRISGLDGYERVDWLVDHEHVGHTHSGKYLWPLKKGSHAVRASIWDGQTKLYETEEVRFHVR